MEIKIVPSGRIDYCGDCKKDHGYDCPKDSPLYQQGWEDRKAFDIKLLKRMPSYWVDRMIRTIKNAL